MVPRGSGWVWVANLVPSYASGSLLNAGFELGYRPTLHLGNSFAVGLNVAPLHVTGPPASGRDRLPTSCASACACVPETVPRCMAATRSR